MKTSFPHLVAITALLGCVQASAQESLPLPPSSNSTTPPSSNNTTPPNSNYTTPPNSNYTAPPNSNYALPAHDYWVHDANLPDLVKLDECADQLAQVARHLHEDVHQLSQDYIHSAAIEGYVDNLDRLQKHMHEILHEAVESGAESTDLIQHVKSDVRQVKTLLNRLYHELRHQGSDGVRSQDYRAMAHMRRVIVQEATPLVRKTELELYGYAYNDYHCPFGRPIYSSGGYHGGYGPNH
jgi:hypothetical protein